ncbi:MAG: hypothetical protein CMG64_04860 [Candidatus Marinimicrobia bacterium]|nr:hypothetical protein [Candidatus Neomarinimicrobiota bacterium]|tara:strand:+ start:277 stop:744 length:468 start_codon:yes stop_codon:yes gene_type:complete
MNKNIIFFIITLMLFSCTASPRYSSATKKNIKKKISKKKNKKSYSVSDELIGISSWYGPNFHGKLTANGEVFDQYGLTAAHRDLPLNTVVRVTNLDNRKSLIIRINDRGPYIDEHLRILDCSYGAAKKLGFLESGTANVSIKIIEIGDGVYMHHN